MKGTTVRRLMTALALGLLPAGCVGPFAKLTDAPPAPPKTTSGKAVTFLDLTGAAKVEVDAATVLETARVNYAYRLQVLQGYYGKIGDMDKLTWARREAKNLQQVQTFRWVGIPEIRPPKGESVAGADERLLVEYVVTARKQYLDALGALRKRYESSGATFRASLVRNMQERFDPIRTYKYFLHAEVPPPNLMPAAVIPAADKLFEEARRLYRSGKILPAVTDYRKQRRALVLFRRLIDRYPTSNTIAEAAFYTGEIYKEYFREYVRAVYWYRRAWQWDPTLTLPARFQAATVYDFHLQNKARAVECYRGTIEHEQFKWNNVRYAYQRIEELTGKPAVVKPKKPTPPAAPGGPSR